MSQLSAEMSELIVYQGFVRICIALLSDCLRVISVEMHMRFELGPVKCYDLSHHGVVI